MSTQINQIFNVGLENSIYREESFTLENLDDSNVILTSQFCSLGFIRLSEIALDYAMQLDVNYDPTKDSYIRINHVADLPQNAYALLKPFQNITVKINDSPVNDFEFNNGPSCIKDIYRNNLTMGEIESKLLYKSGNQFTNNELNICKTLSVTGSTKLRVEKQSNGVKVINQTWDNIWKPIQRALTITGEQISDVTISTIHNQVLLRHLHPFFESDVSLPPNTKFTITFVINTKKSQSIFLDSEGDRIIGMKVKPTEFKLGYFFNLIKRGAGFQSESKQGIKLYWPVRYYSTILEASNNNMDINPIFNGSVNNLIADQSTREFIINVRDYTPDYLYFFCEQFNSDKTYFDGNLYSPSKQWDNFKVCKDLYGRQFKNYFASPIPMQIERIELYSTNDNLCYKQIINSNNGPDYITTTYFNTNGLHHGNVYTFNFSKALFEFLPSKNTVELIKLKITFSTKYTFTTFKALLEAESLGAITEPRDSIPPYNTLDADFNEELKMQLCVVSERKLFNYLNSTGSFYGGNVNLPY